MKLCLSALFATLFLFHTAAVADNGDDLDTATWTIQGCDTPAGQVIGTVRAINMDNLTVQCEIGNMGATACALTEELKAKQKKFLDSCTSKGLTGYCCMPCDVACGL